MRNVLKSCVLMLFLCSIGACSCSKHTVSLPVFADTARNDQPALTGRLIFHAYTCYDCNDSKLYRYDFASGKLQLLNANWNISNAMNAHFSPDGNSIVFMGKPAGTDNWDVYLWHPASSIQPTDLTLAAGNARDEDPKFSGDGNRIIFKRNGLLKEMDTLGNITRSFTVPQAEASMPYYAKGNSVLLYSGSESTGNTADIYQLNLADGTAQPLSSIAGLEEYYPVAMDDTSFLFTRWVSSGNRNDQVYRGFFNGHATVSLAFNEPGENYSDAFPVNDRYVILSSTRPGGKGGYDLYLADINTGNRWSLSRYNAGINSSANELGACYSGN